MTVLRDLSDYDDGELSDTWLTLLGTASTELDASEDSRDSRDSVGGATSDGIESPIPVTADPWSELLRAQGVEVVDLQQSGSHMIHIARVSFSEQEVEQALQHLQEQ